ncbi:MULTISPECIES: succinic semialdehyde dehydrogenase [Mycobacterium]|uniref:Putative succinate-semialdehyde dehydrogenase [NADP(+)] 2 n=1 Tax=Mycobacterium kiyosense TaxID=2871094 RepID=A0A9P3Q1V2_9MYCO|nr:MULTISPECIES: succinic semialdehyde dehydrogenase [Mycobacterium]BDB42728.1 putative succinate-semialdehyde dehydrogenase [NADP(+)] 2 [Mycobacterium kiyosense]BDE14022.1 putative succinate-semialdehyde dehydrogenase [NADP(+)] 2 [Mycobacterium sp. 20KCMC460]GLB81222.1 putative succinate-semialdehyde dehydrogenase [NADP(+)] 2 [Mycobacterium kiyosense]GLB88253.1 putative succinate-semialdehyde dehydrogenase [NADP(+)] 2 [Mycobacterium kiyosense]GLB94558.1 putative succinate-semialdehyde dehydro
MPAPSAEVFDRLRRLAAIDDVDERPTKTIDEVFTGRPLTTIPVGTAADVDAAFLKARAAQAEWAARPVAERIEVIRRYRDLVVANREFLMDLLQAEAGKARWAAQEEIVDLMANANYYVRVAAGLLEPRKVQSLLPAIGKTTVCYQPKGVVGVISPWNYPMTLTASDSVPALLAGNAVVLKPDSQTPYCALACAELLYRAGLPRALYAVVPGPGSVVGTAITQNCDYLMFTGSSETGSHLAEQAGRRLIGFSAELGGKNAMIVTRGANLDKVAKAATRACFSNAGQLCISIERIYVEKDIADEFAHKFGAAARNMKLGTAYDFSVDMGSLISEGQLKTVSAHVEDATAKGAKVIAGGKARPDIGPLFYEPTVLTDVTPEMECAANETFGPLVSIYPVADVEEAVEKANDTQYGLNASVWAGSPAEGQRIAARLRSGTVNVDEGYAFAWGSLSAPMGGMGISGVGRRHGAEGLLKYTESQTIATARVFNLDPPFGLPKTLWQKSLLPIVRTVMKLPGRT